MASHMKTTNQLVLMGLFTYLNCLELGFSCGFSEDAPPLAYLVSMYLQFANNMTLNSR